MFCNQCNSRLYKNAKFCAQCGKMVEEPESQVEENAKEELVKDEKLVQNTEEPIQTQTENGFSGKAITGFVLSLSGIFIAGIICGILGIIFSSIALKDIKTKNYSGRGMAIAGLVISIIVLSISVISAIFNIIALFSYSTYNIEQSYLNNII